MREFDAQLARLKQVLGVREDQEVAAILGLSKHAFSDRKRRGSFPVKKLLDLKATRPDLPIDDDYVLTGEYRSVRESRERLSSPSGVYEARSVEGLPDVAERPENWEHFDIPSFLRHTSTVEVTVDEKRLLECYQRAGREGRKAIMATAKAMAGINQREAE